MKIDIVTRILTIKWMQKSNKARNWLKLLLMKYLAISNNHLFN